MPCTIDEIAKNWMNPDFKFFVNREGGLKDRMQFLLEEDRIKDEYLGACLNYIREGFLNGVVYELDTRGLIDFIQKWMKLNGGNLIWHYEPVPEDFKLPHINHSSCPRDKEHKGVIKTLGGVLRCAHTTQKRLKPSFIESYSGFDSYSETDSQEYYEDEPMEPDIPDFAFDDDGNLTDKTYKPEVEKYKAEREKFDAEEPTEVIQDVCYAVLNDRRRILSLEKVLNRLNTAPNSANLTVHPFDGWCLSWYVQKWHEQVPDGKARVFNDKFDRDAYKAFPNFVPLSSED